MTGSLSLEINKDEVGEMRGGGELYIRGKCTEDEAMPSSRSGANRDAIRVRAFNDGCSRSRP